ncbi:metal-dependent transcriptional regulator [bacterium]|nr:metal-dependent transcriptional regulator [bacterium]
MPKNPSKSDHNFSVVVENYLKGIWNIGYFNNKETVKGADLARHLGVKPPSVSNMLRKLKRLDYIESSKSPIELTKNGKSKVAKILRKHQLVEMFLEKTLKLSPLELHHDAELLEHAVSDTLLEQINLFLNKPSQDNNGIPIPPIDQSKKGRAWEKSSLSKQSPLSDYIITGVADFDPSSFLEVVKKGLVKGAKFRLLSTSPNIEIQLLKSKRKQELSLDQAQLIRAQLVSTSKEKLSS